MSKATVKDRILSSIRASKEKVFLREDFDRFGNYRQVSHAVKEITQDGILVRAGYGVYARGRASTISGKPVPTETLLTIGLEALRKLGVKADIGKDARALCDGLSTQVPMLTVINVGKARIRRKIGFGKRNIEYETG